VSTRHKHGQTLFNYENHYSARLNKCFFLEIAVTYERKGGKPTGSTLIGYSISTTTRSTEPS
jgi:hypothetical protein